MNVRSERQKGRGVLKGEGIHVRGEGREGRGIFILFTEIFAF